MPDDAIISVETNGTDDLSKTLDEESESTVKWFRENNMLVNTDKFQAIVFQEENNNNNTNITSDIENIATNT